MARGKSQFATLYCTSCKAPNYIIAYNKKNPNYVKEMKKFCSSERQRFVHNRKDTKKSS